MIFCVVFLGFLQLVKVESYGGFAGTLYDFMFDGVKCSHVLVRLKQSDVCTCV